MAEADPTTLEDLLGVDAFRQRVLEDCIHEAKVLLQAKKLGEVETFVDRALQVKPVRSKQLADQRPTLADLLFRVAVHKVTAGEQAAARNRFEQMQALLRPAVQEAQGAARPPLQWSLSLALYGLGFTEQRLGNDRKAADAFRDCVQRRQDLHRTQEGNLRYAWGLMVALARAGRTPEALKVEEATQQRLEAAARASAQQREKMRPFLGEHHFQAACLAAVLGEKVGNGQQDAKLTEEQKVQRRQYLDKAWRHVEQVIDWEARVRSDLATDPDLDLLHRQPDFAERLQKRAAKGPQ
jgi:hypothetical protein